MANTSVRNSVFKEAAGIIKPTFQFSESITSASGYLQMVISPTSININTISDWGTQYPITGFQNGAAYTHHLLADNGQQWDVIWNNYVYLRFVGNVDGTAFDHKSNMGFIGSSVTDKSTYNYSGSNVVLDLDFIDGNIFYKLIFSFIENIKWKIEYYEGLVLKTKETFVNQTNYDDRNYRSLLLSTENLFVTKIEVILTPVVGTPIINTVLPGIIVAKNPPKKIPLIGVKEVDITGVHGSCIYDGYVYGSARHNTEHSIIKISISDSTDITYVDLLGNNGNQDSSLEQILPCNGFLYCLGFGTLYQINPTDLTYRRFEVGILGTIVQNPILSDSEFLYVVGRLKVAKLRAFDLQTSAIEITSITPFVIGEPFVLPDSENGDNFIHSGVVDDNYIYVASTGGSSLDSNLLYPFYKIDKGTMTLSSKTLIPKTTDDMTQNEEFCFLGKEVTGDTSLGYDEGAYAVRKSDLSIKALSSLSSNDYANTTTKRTHNSYASLFFGDFLFDFKVNHRFYQLNSLIANNWNKNIPGLATVGEYSYDSSSGIINEVVFDAQTQTFHCFFWRGNGVLKSMYATFKIPDLPIFLIPDVVNLAITKVDENNYVLNGSIAGNGGTPVTSAAFEILNMDNEVIDIYPTTTENGAKSQPYYSPASFKYRFTATNIKGTSKTAIRTQTGTDQTAPVVQNNPLTIVDPNNFILNAGITSDGNDVITAAFFEVFSTAGALLVTYPVSNTTGDKSQAYQSTMDFDYRFGATNSKGTSYTPIQTVIIGNPDDIYGINGVVYYGNTPAEGVNLILIDLETNGIVWTTLSGNNGVYEFSNLQQGKQYAVAGYRGAQRIITKIKTPFKL